MTTYEAIAVLGPEVKSLCSRNALDAWSVILTELGSAATEAEQVGAAAISLLGSIKNIVDKTGRVPISKNCEFYKKLNAVLAQQHHA